MKHFVVVYNRSRSALDSCTEYDDGHDAMRRRFELERQNPPGTPLEIVVLSAESLDVVHKTHARYFKTPVAILEDAKVQLEPKRHRIGFRSAHAALLSRAAV